MDQKLVLDALIVAVILIMAVIVLAATAARRRGRAHDDRALALGGILAATPASSSTRPSTTELAPNLAAAAAPMSAASGVVEPTSPTTLPTVAAMNDRTPYDLRLPSESSGRWTPPLRNDPKAQTTTPALVRGDDGPEPEDAIDETLVGPASGFATRREWDEVFRHEEQGFARYGRPVTVVVAELEGLDALAAALGQSTAERLIPPVAATMRQSARAADFLARIGLTRFFALLPETDEVAAINYVERVRSTCDMWLEASGVAVRLAVGWAQPTAGGSLAGAMRLADDRMNANRRRQRSRAAPTTTTPLVDNDDATRL